MRPAVSGGYAANVWKRKRSKRLQSSDGRHERSGSMKVKQFAIAAVVFCVAALPTWAMNITIADNVVNGYTSQPFDDPAGGPHGQGLEDNETEPGTIATQEWDLEAVMLTDSTLSLVGGWDWEGGVAGSSYASAPGTEANNWDSGDVFLAIDVGMPVYGDATPSDLKDGYGYDTFSFDFGYNYVLDVDWENATDLGGGDYDVAYTVYAIDATAILQPGFFPSNEDSSPFRYIDGGEYFGEGVASITALASDAYGLYGDFHNQVSFDLADVGLDGFSELWVHNTQECGNDNLMGHYSSVPDGGLTLLLLGVAVSCLAGAHRKFAV